jgi:molybdopterin-containing oxidoreductase family iron-sulfur binding subunit
MACSAGAIVFGNVHDKNSQVNKVRNENKQRTFRVLEQLHVLPNITYLTKVRNTDEIDPHWNGHGGAESEHHAEPVGSKPDGPADAHH